MVDILRMFIKAKRTGNWDLHLQTVYNMLPSFAAAGHNLYTQSAYLYLQMMERLSEEHPDAYESFKNGHHVVRRSDRFWAGLSTDLVIEQMLMRSIVTSGGLTRRRGITEIQRLVWLLLMPAVAEMNFAMQELTKTEFISSEQHREDTRARMEREGHFQDPRNPTGIESLRLRSIPSKQRQWNHRR